MLSEYVPAAHNRQMDMPEADEYDPAWHPGQAELEAVIPEPVP